jgi:DNA replication and repair protein RecF
MEELEKNSDQDFQRGYTTAGPHRDDFKFYLNGKDVLSFGSSGQQRSVVFALKMSEAHLFEKERHEKQVMLLDDIDTELDVERMRKAIGMKEEKMQLIVTTTKPELLEKLEKPVKVVKISDGSIKEITFGIG